MFQFFPDVLVSKPQVISLTYPEFLPASTWFPASSICKDQNWAKLFICWSFNSARETASFLLFMHPSKVVFFFFLITNNGVEFVPLAICCDRYFVQVWTSRYGILWETFFFFKYSCSLLFWLKCVLSPQLYQLLRSAWILNLRGACILDFSSPAHHFQS